MTDTETDEYDTTERVDQYENGARLHIRSKRGTGTRDEDKVSGELHADSVDALEAKRDQLRETVVATLRELRHTQPDSDLLTNDDQRELATELADVLEEFDDLNSSEPQPRSE
ncbi:MAG: hypothetical protein ACI8XM_000021 [Haloarculaceae archaeon]|jgi:hypothetical protein